MLFSYFAAKKRFTGVHDSGDKYLGAFKKIYSKLANSEIYGED
jgi:hypothetical protein